MCRSSAKSSLVRKAGALTSSWRVFTAAETRIMRAPVPQTVSAGRSAAPSATFSAAWSDRHAANYDGKKRSLRWLAYCNQRGG